MRLLSLLLITGSLFATGNFSWVEDGVPVRQGVHIEWQRTGDVGAAGEMIFAWSDTRTGDRDIYVQKIDTSGQLLWGPTGIRATPVDGRQEDPVLVSDGAGGAFLAWIDYRDDEYGDVYAQHLDENGNLSWDPAGVALAVNAGSQQTANMARGAVGSAYVIWNDGSLSESGDIFGTVLSLDGPLATGGTDGFSLVNAPGTQTGHSIETSGSEVVVVWRDTRDVNDPNIYGQRLDVNFTGLWGENGRLVCGNDADQVYPKVAPANGNAVVVSWLDVRNNIKTDIFSQLLDENGDELWTADGLPVTNLSSEQKACRVKSNGIDQIYYVWEDFRNNAQDPDIYMQSINLAGVTQWADDGIPIAEVTLKQKQPRFTLADDGGMFVTWLDERAGGFPKSDIYLQHVDLAGNIGFAENGLALTSGYQYQTGGLVRPDGAGGALVLWSNAASGSIGLTGQHVNASGAESWDADGLEFFFGIDGDAAKFQTLSWGDDAAMIFWEDNRWSGTGAVAMAQVMDGSAGIQFGLDGTVLSENEQQRNPVLTPDNAGGAYLAYTNASTGAEILYAQHVDAELLPTWPGIGYPVNPSSTFGGIQPHLVQGNDGYLYLLWTAFSDLFELIIYGQKYDADGVAQWVDGGLPMSPSEIGGDQYITDVIAMADGSILFIWEAQLGYNNIYVSKLAGDGNLIWTEAVTDASDSQVDAVSAYDGSSNMITVGWQDQRNVALSGVDLYVVTIDTDGNVGTEQLVSNRFGDQNDLQLSFADDNSGVLYAAWQDFNGFQLDVFTKNLTTDTAAEQITTLLTDDKNPALKAVTASRYLLAWEDWSDDISTDLYFYDSEPDSPGHAAGGVPLSLAALSQKEPQIVPFADNTSESMNYLITWLDMRSSGKTELTNIYSQAYTGVITSIDPPVLAKTFKLDRAFPNPFNGAVTLPIRNVAGQQLTLSIYDLQGRELIHETLDSDPGLDYVWNGMDMHGNSLSSGLYLISVSSDQQRFSQKIMLLK